MAQKTNIRELVDIAISHLSENHYSRTTIYNYSWVWRKLIAYSETKGEISYSSDLCEDFIRHFIPNYNSKFSVHKHRILKVLDDIFHNRHVKANYATAPTYIPVCFQSEHHSYKEHLIAKGQKPRTIETKLSRTLVFLRYMEKFKQSLSQLNFHAVTEFQKYLSQIYSKTGQSNIEFTIRDFLKYSEINGAVPIGSSLLLGTIYGHKHGRLPSTFTSDEIGKMLSSVDRTTVSGKRDYAILVLLALLGMRAADICHIKLDAINFCNHTLIYKQQKTGSCETLPLTELIEMALADYLKGARPISDTDFLFIKCEGANRGTAISSGIVYHTVNRYMKKAKIDVSGKRHGPHSIRHSLSSNLLKEGVSLPVISGILGHSSSEITTRYLWMDLEQLRTLALEVPYEK